MTESQAVVYTYGHFLLKRGRWLFCLISDEGQLSGTGYAKTECLETQLIYRYDEAPSVRHFTGRHDDTGHDGCGSSGLVGASGSCKGHAWQVQGILLPQVVRRLAPPDGSVSRVLAVQGREEVPLLRRLVSFAKTRARRWKVFRSACVSTGDATSVCAATDTALGEP